MDYYAKDPCWQHALGLRVEGLEFRFRFHSGFKVYGFGCGVCSSTGVEASLRCIHQDPGWGWEGFCVDAKVVASHSRVS